MPQEVGSGAPPSLGSGHPEEGPQVSSIPAPCLPEAHPDPVTPHSQSHGRGGSAKVGIHFMSTY